MAKRSTNGGNGVRDSAGRFATGNPGGPGNPFARRVAQLRSALLDAVSDDDLREIVSALVTRAKAGDVVAAREVLTRIIGKPGDSVDPDRLDLDDLKIASEMDAEVVSSLCG